MIPLQRLIDLHIEERAGVPSNRELMWEKLGKWQIEQLINIGLKKDSNLLDIGCGPLRLGMYAIPFLEENHYFGIEVWEPYLKLGKRIMKEIGEKKNYKIVIDSDFNYEIFDANFDFAIAQSVLTHMSNKQILKLIKSLKKVMKKNSKFIFTYNNNKFPYIEFYEMEHPMITPANLDEDFFKKLILNYEIKFDKFDIQHPTGQKVGIITF